MKNRKPSKQIYALLIIATTCIGCALILKYGNPFSHPSHELALVSPDTIIKDSTEIQKELDSDNDGLFDWEETLRGTNMEIKDTDNDGTSDGDEVKQNRNPLVAGPGDTAGEPTDSSAIATQDAQVQAAAEMPKTLSAEISKDLLTKLMYLKEKDELTPENKKNLVKELTDFTTQSFVYKKYSKESMLLLDSPTVEQIRVYASNFATIQVDLITRIAEQGEAIQKDILVLSRIYSLEAQRLAEIAIPRVVADIHVSIVNNYSIVSKALEAFKDDTDPVKKAVSIGAYQNAEVDQVQSLNILKNYIKQNGILFTADQEGNYWNTLEDE